MFGEKKAVEFFALGIRDLFDNANRGRSRSFGEVGGTVCSGVDQHRGARVRGQVGMLPRRTPGREEQIPEIVSGRKPNQAGVGISFVVGSENAQQLALQHLAQNLHVVQVTAHRVAHPLTSIIGLSSKAASRAASEAEDTRNHRALHTRCLCEIGWIDESDGTQVRQPCERAITTEDLT